MSKTPSRKNTKPKPAEAPAEDVQRVPASLCIRVALKASQAKVQAALENQAAILHEAVRDLGLPDGATIQGIDGECVVVKGG